MDVDRQVDPARLESAFFWARCRLPKRTQDRKAHWLYQGPRTASRLRGNNVVKTNGGIASVQRRAWLLLVGPVPDGFGVSAACGVMNCVAPHHLALTKAGCTARNGREVA